MFSLLVYFAVSHIASRLCACVYKGLVSMYVLLYFYLFLGFVLYPSFQSLMLLAFGFVFQVYSVWMAKYSLTTE